MSDTAARARSVENVAVGDEIIRHRLSSRVMHWAIALFFFVCLLTGLPIWTPIFGWAAHLFGGLHVCRWLHPWAGAGFFVLSVVMFFHWFAEMRLEKKDREWLGPKLIKYLKNETHDDDVGKYNGGQKLFFFAVSIGAVVLMASGAILWFPESFGQLVREVGILLHDLSFIGFTMLIVAHMYLATAAMPGTFRAMIRGTVEKRWAKFHHPRWFREIK